MPPTGLGVGLGAVIMPLSIIGMILKSQNGGLLGRFRKAGATSPETARKPSTLKLGHNERIEMERYLDAKILVKLDDGRIWLDMARAKRRLLIMTAIVATALTLLAVFGGPLVWDAIASKT